MNIIYCNQCGGHTPEGFALCPLCMYKAGANEKEVKIVLELLTVLKLLKTVNTINTNISRKAGIKSILNIAKRLGGVKVLEIKEKGLIGRMFCKHDYQEGILGKPTYPNFQNIGGERITIICVKCGKIKDSYFRKNIDGS